MTRQEPGSSPAHAPCTLGVPGASTLCKTEEGKAAWRAKELERRHWLKQLLEGIQCEGGNTRMLEAVNWATLKPLQTAPPMEDECSHSNASLCQISLLSFVPNPSKIQAELSEVC